MSRIERSVYRPDAEKKLMEKLEDRLEEWKKELESPEKADGKVLSFGEFVERYPPDFPAQEILPEDTRQEVMRRAYQNYLEHELVTRLAEYVFIQH